MKSSTIVWIVVVIILLLGGWYFFSMPGAAVAPTTTSSATSQTSATTGSTSGNLLLGTNADAALGTYLTASNGLTLYTYANDTAGVSNCTGSCVVNWLPYTVADQSALANLQAGITGTAGTLTRADGTMQVTYNGKPLYFYAHDGAAGDLNGQGVGGVWYVAKP